MNINIDLDEKIVEFVSGKLDKTAEEIEEYIKNIVLSICEEKNIKSEIVSISISSASKEKIRKINKEYRGIDRATDVLSFPIFEREEIENISKQDKEKMLKEIELGDIILCLDVVKEQSIEYNTGILRETLYMITHGVCHLVGYDHIDDDERHEMRSIEEKILSKIGVTNE